MNQWLTDHLPETALALLTATAAFFGKRVWGFGGRLSKLDKRVSIIEKTQVTRKDMDELRASITATVANAAERSEERLDQVLLLLAKHGDTR